MAAACLLACLGARPCYADAALATEVSLIPSAEQIDRLRLSVTESFAAPRLLIAHEENGDGAPKYDLHAVAEGTAPYAFEWRCSVDGGEESLVKRSGQDGDGRDRFELSARAFSLLHDGSTHRFTVTVADAEGRSTSESITVVASSEYAERALPARDALPRVESWWMHDRARLSVAELEPGIDGYERLQREAGEARVASAWRLALEGPDMPAPLHVGALAVRLPVPVSFPIGATHIAVLGIDASGSASRLSARVEGTGAERAAVFETDGLGDFALLADAGMPTARTTPPGLSPRTGDGALAPTFATVAAGSLCVAMLALFMRRESREREGSAHGAL